MAGRGLVSGSRRNVVPKGGWSEAELWRSLPTTLCLPIERKKPTLLGRPLFIVGTNVAKELPCSFARIPHNRIKMAVLLPFPTSSQKFQAISLREDRPPRQSSRRKTKVGFLLLLFSDLSHHRTCGSAYGGSLSAMILFVVSHQ